jgi:hypothetical protein
MNRSLTLHLGTTTYTLSKRFMQLGHLTFSKKATYELTPSSARRGATKQDIAGVLQTKFGMTKREAFELIDQLDRPADELPTLRTPTQAPDLGYRGIPVRPFAPVN